MLFQWGENSRCNGRCNGDQPRDALTISRDSIAFPPNDLILMPADLAGTPNKFAFFEAVRRLAHGFFALIDIDCKAIAATWSKS